MKIFSKSLLMLLGILIAGFTGQVSAKKNWVQKHVSSITSNIKKKPRYYKKKATLGAGISGVTLVAAIAVLVHAKKKIKHITKKLHSSVVVPSDAVQALAPKKTSRLKKALKRYKSLRDFAATVVALSTVTTVGFGLARVGLGMVPEPGRLKRTVTAVENTGRRVGARVAGRLKSFGLYV
jgi:hypothetical protein